MSFQQIPTVYKDNASQFATRVESIPGAHAHVDVVLNLACKDAVRHIRAGRPGEALYRLTRAAMRAERILGPTDWAATSQRGAR